VDVDAGLRLSQRPHTDSRLRADARGCHGGVRQELAAVKCSGPSLALIIYQPQDDWADLFDGDLVEN
jgi:hypothetical protein